MLAAICTEASRRQITIDGETYYIATGPRVLPQGSPASPALTNALSLRLDRRLSQYADSNEWRYTRYADDLTFSRLNNGEKYTNLQIMVLRASSKKITTNSNDTCMFMSAMHLYLDALLVMVKLFYMDGWIAD